MWADGKLAERAEQVGKKVEHPNQSQLNLGLRADESPCSLIGHLFSGGQHVLQLVDQGSLQKSGAAEPTPRSVKVLQDGLDLALQLPLSVY